MGEIDFTKYDKKHLAALTDGMTYDQRAKIWKRYSDCWLKAMEKAKKKGMPEYQWQNYGRRKANVDLREWLNFREEARR